MGKTIRRNSTRTTKDAATVSRQIARQNKRAEQKAATAASTAEFARKGM